MTIDIYLKKIDQGQEIRQNLIELRQALKTEQGQTEWRRVNGQYLPLLMGLLDHEDAKVRRNAALILGELGEQQALPALFEAYRAETQLFVRGAYLKAMGNLDYRPYIPDFKERVQSLLEMTMTPENKKHLSEELKLLREMLLTLEAPEKHIFTGTGRPMDLIVLTSPGFEQLTADTLPGKIREQARILHGGVGVSTQQPEELLDIRTVRGLLFKFCRNPLPDTDYRQVAKAVLAAGLIDYLAACHSGQAPYYFRLDLRTRMVLHEKSQYVKRLAAELEALSGHRLQNSASNYECELRIVENKQGKYSAYLVLTTLPDRRFAYRRHALGASMHPVRAAEIAALSAEYLAGGEDAAILDPFCGTGTLLIERYRRKKAAHLYGLDIYGEAVRLGRENARLAHVPVNFINKDFADFVHSYRFDEIITELPAQTEKMTADKLYDLYLKFIGKLPEWMKEGGYIIVCTTEEAWLRKMADKSGYLRTEAVYHLPGKRETALVILQYGNGDER